MHIIVGITWDDMNEKYSATCEELGFEIEDSSYDGIIEKIKEIASKKMDEKGISASNNLFIMTKERIMDPFSEWTNDKPPMNTNR